MRAAVACRKFPATIIPPEKIVVVYDEISWMLSKDRAVVVRCHNGLSDIIDRMNPIFTRVRIGIGRKIPKEIDLADYVLGKFGEVDETLIGASMKRYLDYDRLLNEGLEKAMNL